MEKGTERTVEQGREQRIVEAIDPPSSQSQTSSVRMNIFQIDTDLILSI